MSTIFLVTGNPNKLVELQAIFPSNIDLQHVKLDIPEIQGEPREIVEDKLQRAYDQVHRPVIVEDVSAELDCLQGLPGPYVKFFEKRLGKAALWTLAEHAGDKSAAIRCTMGYYDGKITTIVDAVVRGTIVPPRGENGFGFDYIFVPEGHQRTTAEMSFDEKNAISWRAKAARALAGQLSV